MYNQQNRPLVTLTGRKGKGGRKPQTYKTRHDKGEIIIKTGNFKKS